MLNIVVFTAFLVGVIIFFAFASWYRCITGKEQQNTNPQFNKFQKEYFIALFPALFADWLNAPYLYKLFSDYGFLEEQIAIIYVGGLFSALVFGTFSGYLVEKYGAIKLSGLSTSAYAIGCFLKLSSDYSTLIISRIICGAATVLLFAAHETWYDKGHSVIHDFPNEWFENTISITSIASSVLAVAAGLFSFLLTEVVGYGAVAPSIMAVPFLIISGYITWKKWNFTNTHVFEHDLPVTTDTLTPRLKFKKAKFSKICGEGLKNIAQNPELLVLGCVQSLYESVLCIFVFLWTPVLDHHHPPLGIVFASFMTLSLVGALFYRICREKNKYYTDYTLIVSLVLSCCGIMACVVSTSPKEEFPILSYLSFLVIEFSMGVYFPAMSNIKRKIKPELQNFAVTAWFRVPLNLIACWGLLMLHHSMNEHGTRKLFMFCFFMVVIATLLSVKLLRIVHQVNEEKSTKPNENAHA